MDRRAFLRLTGFFTVSSAAAGLAACSDDDNATPAEPAGRYVFSEGVASGDPRATSLVFWTRASRATGTDDVALRLEVAGDDKFGSIVARASLTAQSKYDFTVRHKVTGLVAGTRYWYRFVAGSDTSAVGRARTAPAADSSPAQLRFGWFTCQDWTVNHWQAMALMAAEDFDFVVHLGDYIYETIGQDFQAGAAEPAHTALAFPDGTTLGSGKYATTVADYRSLYRRYRGDARLQTVHASFPAIVIWDDHEFTDDAWQDHQTYTNANVEQLARRRAATQAWAEYMPVDWSDVAFDLDAAGFQNIRIYRSFEFGKLMTLVMTDERLYRDDHPVNEAQYAALTGADPVDGNSSIGARYFVPRTTLAAFEANATTALGRAPQILGPTQTQWWKDTMKSSAATWKVWGNEVTLNRMWLDLTASAPAPYNQVFVVNGDVWDGYPTHKAELLGFLRDNAVKNVVAITGDLHAFQAGVVRDDNTPAGTAVLCDFVSAGISSGSMYSYFAAGGSSGPLAPLVATPATFDGVIRANNPDFAYVDHDAQGYASATVTADSFKVTFTKVAKLNADGTAPALASAVAKTTSFTVTAGTTAISVDGTD
ncbi:alkaline phosphatase D family protein [Derxia gummosa]|uniref:Alkaline phosphatase D family protein n=1 Tax=Derxia gummosa DSM 723 TaxID=1121388 RepID=A0A8B6X6I4_9BURK|nr:alkaline phosphatase D family protein [Derxia gummosa]